MNYKNVNNHNESRDATKFLNAKDFIVLKKNTTNKWNEFGVT